MPRKYRDFHKRREYSEYETSSKRLTADLKGGRISQEDFDKAHEALDIRF